MAHRRVRHGDRRGEGPVLPRGRRRLRARRAHRSGSDLDLLLLHKAGAPEAARVAEALWYPIWDSGLRLDHSVRTVSEARRLASEDIKVVLGLLDARVVAGDAALAEQLQGAVLSDWRAMADKRLPDLQALVMDRRQKFGEASQLLEPDLKESYGGLRDATVLAGVAASWVTDVPHQGWQDSVAFLLDVRDALHRVSGRSGDRLVMQEQEAVAVELVGVPDADALLRAVYDSARNIAYASDVTWYRVDRLARGTAAVVLPRPSSADPATGSRSPRASSCRRARPCWRSRRVRRTTRASCSGPRPRPRRPDCRCRRTRSSDSRRRPPTRQCRGRAMSASPSCRSSAPARAWPASGSPSTRRA